MNATKFLGFSRLFSTAGLRSDASAETKKWRPVYWLYAGFIPGVLYSFDAIKITLYHVARAPNVNLLTQLFLLFVFYGLWITVPRICWSLAKSLNLVKPVAWDSVLIRFSGLGLFLSVLHLFLLTILLLSMHARVAWVWEPIHILHAFGETWLGYAGLWLFAYSLATAVILYAFVGKQHRDPTIKRYEVRENGKTLMIPIEDIYWVKAAGNYGELHTKDGITLVRKTLAEIEREITGNGFLRSHRSALINGQHVLAIKPQKNGSGFIIQLSNEEEAPLSRRRLSSFKAVLKVSQ